MRNNDFLTRNFAVGNNVATVNNVATGTVPLNISICGVQAVEAPGRYISN